MRSLALRPAAESDIDAAAEFYAERESIDLGIRFYDAVERTFDRLRASPDIGAVQDWLTGPLAGCRRWPVDDPFGVHLVFYLADAAQIEVLRVLHGARDLPRFFSGSSSPETGP